MRVRLEGDEVNKGRNWCRAMTASLLGSGVILATAMIAPAQSTVSAQIVPNQGPPGTTVTVNGTGNDSHGSGKNHTSEDCARVEVTFEGKVVGSTSCRAFGQFQLTFTVPDASQGVKTVLVN